MTAVKNNNHLKSLKNILLLSTFSLMCILQNVQAEERKDIQSLIKEIDYLIDVAVKMKKDYGGKRNVRVRFNYDALIQQLKVTKQNTAAYFNETGARINLNPPQIADQDLYQIK